MEAVVLRAIKRALLWGTAAPATFALLLGALITWPDSLFAFTLGSGKIVVASDHAIPSDGGERLIRDCERLLDRSPLKSEGRQYRLYVTNDDWRQRLFFVPRPERWGFAWYYGFGGHAFLSGADFEQGRVVHHDREKELVRRSTLADDADARSSDRDHACRREAMKLVEVSRAQ
jgi:hypothetical protein